jgi:hypothetical protein
MKQREGVKKETRRHYVGYFYNGEYHIDYLECVEVYEYDSMGYVFRYKSENYDDTGEVSYGTIANRRYDKGEYIFDICDLDGKHRGYDKYDSKWQIVESRFNQKHSWSYNSVGNIIEEYIEFSNGWWKIKNEYDGEGRVVKSIRVDDKSDILIMHHYYSRDCMGNIVESVVNEDGELLESNVIDRLSNKVIMNRDERIEGEWTAIQRCFKNDIQVSCSSWHSDHIPKSTQINYLDSISDDWHVSVVPSLTCNEDQSEMKGQKCRIVIRDIEYDHWGDGLLDEFGVL